MRNGYTQEYHFIFLCIAITILGGCTNNQQYDQVPKLGIEKGFPGIIIGVQAQNATPWISAAGLANIEKQIPMKKDERFHIASVTKLFTSVAALQLIDENKLSLSSRVDSLLADPPCR